MIMLAIATPASDNLSLLDTAQKQRPWQHARSDPSDREGSRPQLQATVLLATALFHMHPLGFTDLAGGARTASYTSVPSSMQCLSGRAEQCRPSSVLNRCYLRECTSLAHSLAASCNAGVSMRLS